MAKKENTNLIKRHHITKHFLYFTLLIFGIVYSIAGIFIFIDDNDKRNNWIEHTATITEINHSAKFIKISYNYKDVSNTFKSSSYYFWAKHGDKVVIYINPNNYSKVHEDKSELSAVFYFLGIGFLTIGTIIAICINKKEYLFKKLLNSGSRKKLKVISFKSTILSINRATQYKMIVSYNGKEYESEMFTIPRDFDIYNLGMVDFYYNDKMQYYIDIESYRNE